MAALTPHAGHAQVVGITGSPGVGKSTSTNALVSELRKADKRVGVLAVDPSSPFSGGALLGDRVRMQDHATRPRASTSARWPRAATSAGWPGRPRRRCGCSTPPAATWSSSRPWASGRARSRSPGSPTPRVVLLAPGMGDGIQAAKAGILEIGDVYVVNKADRDGAEQVRRDLRSMLALGERPEGALEAADRQDRGPVRPTASTRWWPRSTAPRRGWSPRASSTRRRTRRARDEIEAIAVTALRARWENVHGHDDLDALAEAVVAGEKDPYAAADELLATVTG